MTPRQDNARDPLPISRFDYDLPPELIAQRPVEPRDASRMLVVDRSDGSLSDHIFRDLPDLLSSNDLLVLNDTRVLPARLMARRETGGQVDLLLLSRLDDTGRWQAMARSSRRLHEGERLRILDQEEEDTDQLVTFLGRQEQATVIGIDDEQTVLREYGRVPLPPYITEKLANPDRYQTVYAEQEGSAAAPTAGLHFTPDLLQRARDKGIRAVNVTLHVGLDTFQPVKTDDARQHHIHTEWFSVPAATLEAIRKTRAGQGRVVAVGTTVARTLESIADSLDGREGISGKADIYITPPYRFRVVDAMVTNFHLPRTTLLLMVSAFAGEDLIRRAYQHAIERSYRFYSFGDAMLIV